MRDALQKIGAVSVMGVPVGTAVLFLISMGLGTGIISAARRFRIPPIAVGTGLSALGGIQATRGFLGDGPATVLATAMLVQGADQQFGITDRVAGLVGAIPIGGEALAEGAFAQELGEFEAPLALGEGEGAVYLTDVERKVQATLRAQV